MTKRQPLRTCLAASGAVNTLANSLSEIIGDSPCVLLDWPAHANVGDHLIWLGEKVLLKDHIGAPILSQSSYLDTDLSNIVLKDVVILCHGGGNFGDLYFHHQEFRQRIATTFPNNKVVFLPQSIYYESDEMYAKSKAVLSTCQNVTLFARDAKSFSLGYGLFNKSCVRLGIDAAFALQPHMARLMKYFGTDTHSPLYIVRKDRETMSHINKIADSATVADWVDEDYILNLLSDDACDAAIHANGLDYLVDDHRDTASLRYFLRSVKLFSSASYVVTDRLHGHILALLMGIPCKLHDNTYKKNSNFAKLWTIDDPLLELCR